MLTTYVSIPFSEIILIIFCFDNQVRHTFYWVTQKVLRNVTWLQPLNLLEQASQAEVLPQAGLVLSYQPPPSSLTSPRKDP